MAHQSISRWRELKSITKFAKPDAARERDIIIKKYQ